MDINQKITEELGVKKWQVDAAVKLIDEGNTIPFIARYRKEATGTLDDEQLRRLHERLTYLRNLEEKKEQVLSSIQEQGKLSEELKKQILAAETLVVVEDLYRPYRPKRRTRATIAKEKGLEPLAAIIILQKTKQPVEELAAEYIDPEKDVNTVEEAIAVPAVSGVARNIVIVTDGYISGEREIFNIINQNIANTSFFAFGIGSSVNRYLIDGIAKTGMGESFVVTDSEDAEEAADYFLTYIEAPLLTDIHVEYDGFEAYDTEPEKVPVLFAQRPIVLFGKWRGDPSGTIRIKGKAGGQDYEQEIPVTAEAISEDAGAVRYLWARTRVEKLTDYGYMPTGDQEDPEVRKEITDIGLKYSMMTPYTSFIAVLDIIRNEDGDAADVDQPLPLPSGVTENALGGVSVSSGGYTTGSEPGEIALWVMLAVVMCLPVVRRMRRRRKVRV